MLALRRLAAAALSALCVCLSLASHAATLNVPSQYATIQAGVDAAVNGDTVLVADGTYTGDGNRDIDFGGKNIAVQSVHGPAKTTIDCQGTASANHRGFYIHSSETNAVISGFTVKNGYVVYVPYVSASGDGGGLCITSSSHVSVTDCTVSGNTASSGDDYPTDHGSGNGGGLFIAGGGGGGSILVTNCIVTDCAAVDSGSGDPDNFGSGFGGGICMFDDSSVTDCAVTGNAAGSGGGIFDKNFGDASLHVTDCTISGNTATRYAGGILDDNYSFYSCSISITGCAVTGNTALYYGGIYNRNSGNDDPGVIGTITITGCTVSGNTSSSGGGGGIRTDSYNGTVTSMIDCTVNGNTAPFGGGIDNFNQDDDGGGDDEDNDTPGGIVSMINCTVSGNMASSDYNYGSGVDNGNYGSGIIQMTNCTVVGNIGARTTGINDDGSSAGVTDCIVTNNTNGEIADSSPGVTAVTYSDVKGGYAGTGNIDVDPLFVNAAGGDFHLRAGSPVLGKGIAVFGVTMDKDGVTRPDPPSIGAYEYAATLGSLSPSTKTAGSGAFTLTVHGTGFLSSAVVQWNGAALTTTFVSATKLTAFVSASRLHNAGIEQIAVSTYGAVSKALPFTITPVHLGIAAAIAAGPDGETRILWNRNDGAATVWTLSADGAVDSYGTTYGPFAGWTARTISVGPDNATHLLWTKTDGSMTLWTLPADGSAPLYGSVYGPYAGWSAQSVATSSDSRTHILWTNTNGAMTLWTFPADGSAPLYGPVYGPYAGWTAKAIATGFTNATHVLWTNADGRMTLWTFTDNSSAPTYSPYYGPYVGWTATGLGVDTSGAAHVQWDNTNGAMTLWTVPATGPSIYSPVFGPYAGWSAVGLSLGAGDDSHVLWDNTDGRATPWTLSPNNQFVGAFPTYGPY